KKKFFDHHPNYGLAHIIYKCKTDGAIKYYVPIEEIFDIIKAAHIATGHGGRDRLIQETSLKFANITRELITILSVRTIATKQSNSGGQGFFKSNLKPRMTKLCVRVLRVCSQPRSFRFRRKKLLPEKNRINAINDDEETVTRYGNSMLYNHTSTITSAAAAARVQLLRTTSAAYIIYREQQRRRAVRWKTRGSKVPTNVASCLRTVPDDDRVFTPLPALPHIFCSLYRSSERDDVRVFSLRVGCVCSFSRLIRATAPAASNRIHNKDPMACSEHSARARSDLQSYATLLRVRAHQHTTRKSNITYIQPVTEILGGPDLYIDRGSTINLTCIVQQSPEPPAYIFWNHNDASCWAKEEKKGKISRSAKIISYDSSRGGVSVVTEKGDSTTSFLLVQQAKPSDSGKYTCNPSNAQTKSITVHVLNELLEDCYCCSRHEIKLLKNAIRKPFQHRITDVSQIFFVVS
ncbi:unnamed protein product, partial [Trichogramma brassicae]